MSKGVVKYYHPTKEFGFIKTADGEPDTFFHISVCEFDIIPEVGTEVSFTIGTDSRTGKTKATRVDLVA